LTAAAGRETGDREGSWADLAGADAARAYRAAWALVDRPGETVAFLRQRLRPVAPAKPQRLRRLIAELDSDSFEARKQATAELKELGPAAAAAVRQALAGRPSAEQRRRLEDLLHRMAAPTLSAEELQAVRAVAVLEHIGTPAARELLATLASGVADARRTREAKVALERLARRPGP
jgi:hypothetical protein